MLRSEYLPIKSGSLSELAASFARLVVSCVDELSVEMRLVKPSSTATLSAAFCNG